MCPGTPSAPRRSLRSVGVVGQHDLAGLEHVAALGDLERVVRVLLDQQDRRALRVDLADRLVDLVDDHRREPSEGSSSSSSFGAGHQRAADREHLLLAAGHRPRLLALALLEAREQLEDAVDVVADRGVAAQVKAPISRFSSTVIRGKIRRPSGDLRDAELDDLVRRAGRDLAPSNRIAPRRARFSPEIERSVVDLPAPLEPISVTISPSLTVSEMPLSASIEP